jgi:hypothetical protein
MGSFGPLFCKVEIASRGNSNSVILQRVNENDFPLFIECCTYSDLSYWEVQTRAPCIKILRHGTEVAGNFVYDLSTYIVLGIAANSSKLQACRNAL